MSFGVSLSITNGSIRRHGGDAAPSVPAVFADDFDRADGPLEGGNWTVLFGSATAFDIVGGQVVTDEATDTGIACPDLSVGSAAYVEGDVHALINAGGIALIQNEQNYIYLRVNSTNPTNGLLSVNGRTADTPFGPITAPANAALIGDRIRLEVNGANWQTYKNDTPVHNGTLTTALTNLRGGFINRVTAGIVWDNFEHGAL